MTHKVKSGTHLCFALSLLLGVLISGCRQSGDPASGSQASPAESAASPTSALGSPTPSPRPPASPIEFSDVTQSAGIQFKHHNGATGQKYFAETVGSGCAFFDYDNDGWQDILLINSADLSTAPKKQRSMMALYHNNQNGTFTDVTRDAGLDKPVFGIGVAVADYDNDGATDVFVTALKGSLLFRNLGQGRFENVTRKMGLGNSSSFPTSAAWLDYDKDGKLDLFICGYVDWSVGRDISCRNDAGDKAYCTAASYGALLPTLYRNLGSTFEDVTRQTRLAELPGRSLGAIVVDYDRDGWPDMLVTQDGESGRLYHNNGRGEFTETAVHAGIAGHPGGEASIARGGDAADFERTGLPGFAVARGNSLLALYRNEGKAGGLFTEQASAAIGQDTRAGNGYGTLFFDYDLDSWPDILVTYGLPGEKSGLQLLRNAGKGKFTDVSRKAGAAFQPALNARGGAYGDYDNDGDLDILLSTNGGRAYLLRNDGGNQNNFLRFRLTGATSNRSALGAKIAVFLPDGTRLWNYVRSASGYCSQSEVEVTFGVGQVDRVPRVEIEWPGGRKDDLADLATRQLYKIKEGSGIVR